MQIERAGVCRCFGGASDRKRPRQRLHVLGRFGQDVGQVRVADFLINLFEDREITFYRDVKRLPAAIAASKS